MFLPILRGHKKRKKKGDYPLGSCRRYNDNRIQIESKQRLAMRTHDVSAFRCSVARGETRAKSSSSSRGTERALRPAGVTITAQNHPRKSSTIRRNQITTRHVHPRPLAPPSTHSVTTPDEGNRRGVKTHIPLSLPGMACNDPARRTSGRRRRCKRILAMSSWMSQRYYITVLVIRRESSRLRTGSLM